MQLRRNEIMTGLLVLGTVAVLTFILIMLGAPGLFRPLVIYKLYFDNAAGIKLGAPVLLAGRKVGQVKSLNSPVSREEAAGALEAAANLGTADRTGRDRARPRFPASRCGSTSRSIAPLWFIRTPMSGLMTLGLLGETAIDISGGNDHSGKAEAGQVFVGTRVPDFSEAIAKLLGIVGPVATEATATLKTLQSTVTNLGKLTDDDSPLTLSLGQFKTFTEHLNELTAQDSSLSKSLAHIEDLSNQLTKNDNITVTLANFRASSEELKVALDRLGPDLEATLSNAKDFTGTLRTQPWRLIWPTTKKYPQEEATPIPVRRATRVRH